MTFAFTDHAIERFISRHAPELTKVEALAYLEEASADAVKLKAKTFDGSTMWRMGEVTVVTTRDSGSTEDVVLTVLPTKTRFKHHGIPLEELEMALERVSDHAARKEVRLDALPAVTNLEPAAELAASVAAHKKAVSVTSPLSASKADLRAYWHAVLVEKSIETSREKTMRAVMHNVIDARRVRASLRIAVRALRAGDAESIARALTMIKKVDEHLTSDKFLSLTEEQVMDALQAEEAQACACEGEDEGASDEE